ncbi:MAG: LysM peptidoglycan-binding domain-containing protein [Chloroflexi bacterium]|nr:LysM peptidoglycan-binding domain-containing protein [Chloroflexota bacterium]
MTERGLPSIDGAPACPFVAFEDDRESRSTSPDHRHRCFAEPLPAPRAVAHQEAYCLSSAFPVCPTFQDWARREAAHARGDGERPAPAPTAIPRAGVAAAPPPDSADDDGVEDDEAGERDTASSPGAGRGSTAPFEEPTIRRNPPRDWAAPPPWASGGSAGSAARRSADGRGAAEIAGTPQFLAGRSEEGRGLAGSAADRLASGGRAAVPDALVPSSVHVSGGVPSAAAAPDAELADLVGQARTGDRPAHGYQPAARPGNRPRVSSTRSAPARDAIVGPAWERSRRYEAYPTIRTRVGMPQLPRLAVLAVALAIAAVALFFLPALLGVGGGGGGGTGTSTPSPTASQGVESSSSPGPSVSVAPSPQVYVVKKGDLMSKIAARFGLTTQQLCDANKATIADCDKINIGDELIIPTTAPDVINDASAEPSAS